MSPMRSRMPSALLRALLTVGAAAALAAGCASPPPRGTSTSAELTGPAGVSTAATGSPLQPTPEESLSSDSPPVSTTTPSQAGRATPVEVPGTVSAVKDGCLLFTAGDMAESWVLIGQTKGLEPGDKVRLKGVMIDTPQQGCPMGLPFDVSSYERIG